MPTTTLGELILATQEEIVSLKNDRFFRSGDSLDARNAETPVSSISITRQINKAIADILIETRYRMSEETLALAANTRTYPLPTSWLDVISVSIANSRLRKTNLRDLEAREPGFRSVASSATPRRYYLNGTSQIGFDIPPNAAITAYLTVVKDTTALTALADVPTDFPATFCYLISTRAAWHCCKIDANNPAAQTRLKELESVYVSGIMQLKGFVSERMAFDADAPVALPLPNKT